MRSGTAPTVEVLYFAECPNYEAAVEAVREALAEAGIEAPVELVEIETEAAAERAQFYGSPTVRVNGRDVFPPADPHRRPALACRVYRTPNGRIAPAPPRVAILAALRGL